MGVNLQRFPQEPAVGNAGTTAKVITEYAVATGKASCLVAAFCTIGIVYADSAKSP
jgi:hypothetical protein